jgi:hypothetical protein
VVARGILHEARLDAHICAMCRADLPRSAAVRSLPSSPRKHSAATDTRELLNWVASQPVWSDFAFVVLTEHGGGWNAIRPRTA